MKLMQTGLKPLDEMLGGGLPGGSLTMIASKGEGHLSLASWLLAEIRRKRGVLISSLPVPDQQEGERLLPPNLSNVLKDVVLDINGPKGIVDAVQTLKEKKAVATFVVAIEQSDGEELSFPLNAQELDWISNAFFALKQLAVETETAIIVNAPLVYQEDRLPELRDLRSYGPILQSLDVVLFPVWNGPHGLDDPAELIVAKNRYGQTGSFPFCLNDIKPLL